MDSTIDSIKKISEKTQMKKRNNIQGKWNKL